VVVEQKTVEVVLLVDLVVEAVENQQDQKV
jgi:hypothetical protein